MCQTCGNHLCGGCGNWPFNRPFYNPPYTTPFNRQCAPPVPPVPPWPCPTCKPCAQTGCLNYIMSDCVTMSKAYTCLGIGLNDTLTIAFNKVEALCSLVAQQPSPPLACPTWTTLTLTSPWSSADIGATAQIPQVSNISLCVVRLRGMAIREFTVTGEEDGCTKRIFNLGTLPAGTFPLKNRVLSTVVNVVETSAPSANQEHLSPAWLLVSTTGVLSIVFYADRCLSVANGPFKVIATLDGLTYETN